MIGPRSRRALLAVAAAVLVGVVVGGVLHLASGDGRGGERAGGDATRDATRDDVATPDDVPDQAYQDALDEVVDEIEQSGAGAREAIEQGDREGLRRFADAWARATEQLAEVEPPEEVAEPHEEMVAAMRELGEANEAMVDAAPDAAEVRSIYEQTFESPARDRFTRARCEIQEAGWLLLPEEECETLE